MMRTRHSTIRVAARWRSGFTLLEVLVATTLLLFIIGVSTQFMRRQSQGISQSAGRWEAQQNAYFAISSLERELRTAGIGVVDKQPMVVMAAPMAIVFNSNLVSRVPGDLASVYVDTDADSDAVEAFRSADKTTLPNSSVPYPDTTYMANGGVPTSAETIAFWLSKDSTSKANNEYIMFRRVNAMPPRVVATGIIANPTDTIFQYFKADTAGNLTAITPATLPLYHSALIHGSPADTGKGAMIDSIVSVRVRLTTIYHDARNGDATRRLERTIRIMNAGLNNTTTCGDAPLGVAPTALVAIIAGGPPVVIINWTRSLDEVTGEKDVERYALYKRSASQTTFSEPFSSVPAGTASYMFTDTDVHSGEQWVYGVTAIDCTPTSSSVTATGIITIP
ncbi:MAG TPA: prepilin-type N-terminal cleavage/methylation domain-containing protein [Gemmatimonadaceae bacterium]|jgi:prepilin-type N-terminal cleavage/methylation domain-containing protein